MATLQKNPAAVALGQLGGRVTSDAKAEAARANGALGGRPRKSGKADRRCKASWEQKRPASMRKSVAQPWKKGGAR